jgi:carboxyl-terminal processing protease
LLNYAFTLVYKNYYQKYPAQELFYKVLKGLGKELDPFTHFEPPRTNKNITTQLKGKYGGLGFIVSKKDGYLVVISPFEGTPAYKAGLQPGDLIVKINAKRTHNMSLNEAVSLMKGEPGTKVTLTIKREGKKGLIVKELTREIIKLPVVRKYYFKKEKIGYVRLIQFNEDAGGDTRKAFEEIKAKHPDVKGLILDLRHNPGGFLRNAVKVASIFLPQGKLVVYTKGRIPTANESYLVKDTPVFPEKPLVVLVDRGSASASEIVTGALKDWKRAIIVGKKTFGKGSVQNIFNLPDGSAFYITVAHYYTPKGVCINKIGIEPDIDVDYKLLEKSKKNVVKKKDSDKLEKQIETALDKMKNVQKTGSKAKKVQKKSADKKKGTTEKVVSKKSKAKDKNKPLMDTQLKSALDILKALSILHK